MAKVRVSTEVKAPVERVFERFTDIEHAAERVPGSRRSQSCRLVRSTWAIHGPRPVRSWDVLTTR